MVTMPASAALRFAKDVRQIKKAADVLAALQNAIPANDIRVAAAWYLPKSYTDHTAIVPGKTRLGLFAPARAARAFLDAGRYQEAFTQQPLSKQRQSSSVDSVSVTEST